eukprot:gene13162-biopygen2115
MTTTVEDYDALLRELENCRIKNQTLIKHNDELKLISETTMHENILLKSQLVPELSPYHFGHDLLTSLNLPFCNTKCCIVLLDSSGARQCKKNRQATGLLCTTHASSPKHVAEKVNKAYATRCFERQAKVISASQTQSDCVTAYTSACDDNNYATPGLDIRTRYVMEKTGVLPSDLGKYSTEGFARDAAVLRRQLGPGFSFETLEGEGSPQHGSLVCSFKQLVTAEAIECVAEKFQGTFVSNVAASSAAVKSAYDSAVSASNQTYGIGALDSNGDILLRGNLRISETANIYKGYTHSMYLTSNGIVVSAGSDANGQLGRGASSANVVINANIVPMLMPSGSNVSARAISAGGYHSAVLLNNGSAYLCGKNDQGQCGASPSLVPQANSLGIISTLSNVVDVACGHEHTLFTRYDGQVLGFGRNDRGQLGQGNKTSPVTSVVQVLAGGGAGSSNGLSVEIAAGFNHSAYIKNDNTIFVFGANDKGQLGLGQTTTEALTPTQLVGYAGYDIACGRNHTVISTTPDPLTFNYTGNNALIAFGDNAYGQVGDNNPNVTTRWFPNRIHDGTFKKTLGVGCDTSSSAYVDSDGVLFITDTVPNLFVNFTGQHRCFVDALAPARLRDHEGLVVVTDKNAYASGLLRGRQRAMTINQALPLVSLSKVPKDPRAFGVISLTQDHPAGPSAAISGTELLKIAEQGDVRVQINSIGEGCIWVCDETGSTIHAGNRHDGEQNMRCFVDTAGNCIVKCFSATCDNHAPACIGRLAEPGGDEWDAGALHVNSRYIDIDACLEMKQAVDVWLDPERKDVNTLSVRSPMGSGKSTMLDALLERVGEDKTVLVVTYRQSLALEHKRKLARRGFVSYLDADVTPQDLRQRDKTPRVICQIESLHKLAKHTCMRYLTSGFDIVVLDEVESLLRHFMSPTVVNPLSEIQGLADTLNATTTGVVTMDATWGSVTKDFLKQAGLRNLLVINDYRSTENARTFAISKDEATWSAQIRDDIIAGRNVVVVSLSQERAMQVHKAALDTFDDPKDAARLCLLHTSKTADAVKAMLIDVDALWSSKRIVVYTPTISAGVDFSTEHFDRMYLYLCPGSAAPMGALQMTGRVRHLVDTDVRTLVAKNMRVAREATRQHLTHVDLYQWLRWMEGFSTCLDVKHVPAIDGGDDHTLQELSGGVLAPLFATVAPPTLKMTVESYFLAEIYNASFDYVSCFADLLEHAGHRMDLGTSYAAVSAARVHAPPEGDMEATSEFLMRVLKAQEQLDALTGVVPVLVPVATPAPDAVPTPVTGTVPTPVPTPVATPAPDAVPTPVTGTVPTPVPVAGTDIPTAMRRKDLMDAIEQRVMANDASEDDKFILYLSRYCSAWGIDRVDEAFLMENKPGAVGSPKARLLSRLVCPILRPVPSRRP